MKKLLLISLLSLIFLSPSIFATPVDLIEPSSPTEQSSQKENFFNRIFKRNHKKRLRKINKKLKREAIQCDQITTINGDEIKVVIVEMNAKRIRYKKCDYENGPTRTIRIQDIFMIKYAGGGKKLFVDVERLRNHQIEDEGEVHSSRKLHVRGVGFALGLLLGLLGIFFTAIGFEMPERKFALRGALVGMLTRLFVILIFFFVLGLFF